MPRPAKPARLWLRPGAKNREAVWIIKDGDRRISTGCPENARADAEGQLAEYLAAKHNPAPVSGPRHSAEVPLADVLSIYLDEVVPKQANQAKALERIGRLEDWWSDKMLADVTPATCRSYSAFRAKVRREERAAREREAAIKGKKPAKRKRPEADEKGGARRDLEDLRAAINHHAKRGLHTGTIMVELPPKGQRRTEWLTRDEVAKLLWTCYRHGRTVRLPRGRNKGEVVESEWHDLRHIARFILMGVYTGSRSGAILSASIHAGANRSFIDLDSGIFYRLAEGKQETNKRQPPVRLPPRLLAHLRRWRDKKVVASYAVEWDGDRIKSVKVGWKRALELAGLDHREITPHTLRHTAATWLMQRGVDPWVAAGFLGMSLQTLLQTYGHHHPDFMRGAVDAITKKHGT